MLDSFDVPDEAMALDATRLPWLVDRYLSEIRGRVSVDSRLKYRQKINHFLKWSAIYQELHQSDMADFANYLAESSLKITTQADVVMRVSQLFIWAYRRKFAQQDYSLWLPVIKAPAPLFAPVSLADVDALLLACLRTRYAARNQCLVAIMAGAGLRLEETVALNAQDVSHDGEFYSIQVHSGKGTKSRTVILVRYAEYVSTWLAALGAKGPLFISQKGERLKAGSAHNEFKKIADLAKLDLTCHSLRRHFASQWIIDNPGRLIELQMQLGHADISMTAAYVRLSGDHVKSLLRNKT